MTLFNNYKGRFIVYTAALGAPIKNKIYQKQTPPFRRGLQINLC